MKQKYFYKVTTQELRSCIIRNLRGIFVQYKIDKWVYPKIKHSKLFVFHTLRQAKRFQNLCSCVFKCKATYAIEYEGYTPRVFDSELDELKDFWEPSPTVKAWPFVKVPRGTVLVDAVKLISEVK